LEKERSEKMKYEIFGFLSSEGWSGVIQLAYLMFVGVILAYSIVYYFLIYRSFVYEPKPRRISIKFNLVKIGVLGAGLYYLCII
jgi:hypothetical protein